MMTNIALTLLATPEGSYIPSSPSLPKLRKVKYFVPSPEAY